MTPAEKLALADRLRRTALELREAALRRTHPDLSDDEIRRRLRHAGT